ncbi:MAG: hypothetical protein RIT45_3149 [Pseudomonadota bacterium]|jgi:hypothetical protein
MSTPANTEVPVALRRWFVVHFWADVLFALPLFLAPQAMLEAFGWQQIDPITARLVAAALFGIGIESWLGRNADRSSFLTMLQLKVIWSATATIGIAWSLLDGAHGRPPFAWAVLAIFAGFHVLWLSWRIRLGRMG